MESPWGGVLTFSIGGMARCCPRRSAYRGAALALGLSQLECDARIVRGACGTDPNVLGDTNAGLRDPMATSSTLDDQVQRPRSKHFGSRPFLGTDKSRGPAEDTIASPPAAALKTQERALAAGGCGGGW